MNDSTLAKARNRIRNTASRSESGCWEWPKVSSDGYAKMRVDNIYDRVHRWAYRAFIGPITGDLHVLHHCDNKRCCNPSHLFLGTHGDNMNDMAEKGIAARELRNSRGKLTDEQVVELRAKSARGFPVSWLAAEYGLSRTYVSNIVTNRVVKNGRIARHHALSTRAQ